MNQVTKQVELFVHTVGVVMPGITRKIVRDPLVETINQGTKQMEVPQRTVGVV